MMFNTATVILFTLLGALTGGLVVLFEQWNTRRETALFWGEVYEAAEPLAHELFEDAYARLRQEVSESAMRIQHLQQEAFTLRAENNKLVIQLLASAPPVESWKFVEPTDSRLVPATKSSSEEDDWEW